MNDGGDGITVGKSRSSQLQMHVSLPASIMNLTVASRSASPALFEETDSL